MNLDFYLPTRLVTGRGCVGKAGARLAGLGGRCLVVTGRSSARLSGALADVEAVLEEQGIDYAVYDQVGQNPLLSACKEAGALARQQQADFIIGIGGGSPLDAAKAAAVYAANDLELLDIFSMDWPNPALPVVLVGTTAGTGSEVGPVAVLTKPDGRKQSISREDCIPVLALGDPHYTASLPYDFTVSTALDALSHGVEGYFSTGANDLSDLFAIQAVELLAPGLRELAELPRGAEIPPALREPLYYASVLAGITLGRCGTCYCHNLGYRLTEDYSVAHGTACAAFLEDFLRRQTRLLPEKAERLYQKAGTCLEELCGLLNRLNPPLRHISMSEAERRELAASAAKAKNFARTAPEGYTEGEAYTLLTRLFGGEGE